MTEVMIRETPEPAGLGGWLILPILHMFIDMAVALISVLVALAIPGPPTNNESHEAVAMYLLASALIAAFAIYCATRLFQKKRDVPQLMQGFYLLGFVKFAATAVLQRLFPDIRIPSIDHTSFGSVVGVAIASGIWIAYFQKSVRVRNTFIN